MKLWGGRFTKETDQAVHEFSASLSVDQRLWNVDIDGSMAHAQMLGKQNIISQTESQLLLTGLKELRADLESGKLKLNPAAEDIHSEIETLLTQKIGAVAGKLHTARSRNDQVTTDTRLYLRKEGHVLLGQIQKLQTTILSISEKHKETLMPGYTHMQPAQPISLAHHLMAYFWMLCRDHERLSQGIKRANLSPLGSAALAGTGFPLDRRQVATDLGFDGVTANSLDSVSDRDYVIEFLSNCSILMMHLSRLSEELILWSSPNFGFVELSDQVTTGSSIMPQKKNPDVAELIRGRVGILYGNLIGALTMMKGLPLSYNRDQQEDKTFLFQGLDTTLSCVTLMNLMLTQAAWNPEKMAASLKGDFSNATDLADDLVKKGATFRQAHEVVGQVVNYCIQNKVILENISLPQLKEFSPLFNEESLKKLPHLAVMKARTSEGGTSPVALEVQIQKAKLFLQEIQ